MRDATYPLPEHPMLAEVAATLEEAGYWAQITDDQWRTVYATNALRATYGGVSGRLAHVPAGCNCFSAEALEAARSWRFGPNSVERMAVMLEAFGGWLLTDLGADQLRREVAPELLGVLDRLTPSDGEALWYPARSDSIGSEIPVAGTVWRVRDHDGRRIGNVAMVKPAASMVVLGAYASMADPGHLARVLQLAMARRRPAAILFADLEGSSALGRRLSTSGYFAVGRRLVRAADACIIDAGGIVGRHVGDGVVAFFPEEVAGSESAAARGCIAAARALRIEFAEVAARSDLSPEDVSLRFGLHWGATLHMGAITTGARFEVTALGDEVNETARIEACATGGKALASKALVERLDRDDAAALDLDPDRAAYTALGDLATATDKARRDAPAIAVCEV